MQQDEAEDRSGSPEVGEPVVFDALLTPHRSLSPFGFFLLMGAVALVGFAMGVTFLMMGAWPVFGFCGAEIGLFYLLFQMSYRSARMFERVRLTPSLLMVERHDLKGRVRRWTFQPYWLRVSMDDPPRHESRVVLSSHGRSLTVGSFLSPEERLDFARALRRALDRTRTAAV
ncbi:MAG: DUF2244 domain-containing protein [Rhodospirillaceae bacterium]|nr:DUF2244 domain-containing protein [Rhodospirillaceae bacterium]